MKEFLRSAMRFSWAIGLLGAKEVGAQLMSPPADSDKASGLNDNSHLASGPECDQHRQAVAPNVASSLSHINRGRLDHVRLVVLGEGLAAGIGDFNLTEETQRASFPAVIATQMGAIFAQALLEAPGIGGLAGFADLPVVVPAPLQSTVLTQLPPGNVSNLAIPGFTLSDALNFRPAQPLIHRHDAKQTAVNLNWGALAIAQGLVNDLPTQLEYAVRQSPTLTVVELGYYEAIEALVQQQPELVSVPVRYRAQYAEIVNRLQNVGSDILILTIPNPADAAYCSTIATASKILKVEPEFLFTGYRIREDDLITVKGLNEISFQIFARTLQPLPAGSIVKSGICSEVGNRIAELNHALVSLANERGVVVYDLNDFFLRLRNAGATAGSRTLTAEYLGGFYSLNGFYPGAAGQALIANEILQTLNATYEADFPLVGLSTVVAQDPVAAYKQAGGPNWKTPDLLQSAKEYAAANYKPKAGEAMRSDNLADNPWRPLETSAREPDGTPLPVALRLPDGLEQILPLNSESSYFGDGITAINGCTSQEIQWGSSGNFLFGGLAMVDSHLSGNLRIKFLPPVNDVSQFEVSFVDGFSGEDSVLVTPQFFKMAFQQNRVDPVPGTVSKGTLNLLTGEVTGLTIYAAYRSTALMALIGVNPTFPKQPLSFPGQYGSAWARFEQRADGKLDFIFYGTTFVPLGTGIVWPLNFVGPTGDFATIPANGTVMHPHLHLSTKDLAISHSPAISDVPFNSIQEFTLYTHNSSFGDAFHLNVPAMGGPTKGRSELLGRLQVQFGGKTQNSVPFAIWALAPGGIMAELPDSPITQVFPGRLWPGPQGFNENLRFPQRTYPLDDLSILADPFDICVGALDLRTGRSINQLLHRSFISQDLIFALLRVEPRTPKDSFFFRGPAVLQRGRGRLVFRFQGIVGIPYPEGFRFPRPDFATAFVVGPGSRLDPFLWFHALQDVGMGGAAKEGVLEHIRSSTGDDFSCRYNIPLDLARERPVFEYENHTQGGYFRLHSLAWVGFSDSGSAHNGNHEYDTVTFSGFGVWSNAGVKSLQQAAVQISTSSEKPYVGIQIANGDVSNVNTKPMIESDALP